MIALWTHHLWQSTLFAIGAGLLTLLFRKERAQVRYWLWLMASLKFLVPFGLLIYLGSYLDRVPAAHRIAAGIPQFGIPFPDALPPVPSPTGAVNWAPAALLILWACGFTSVVLIRFQGWRRIRAAVRASVPIDIPSPIEIRSVPAGSGHLLEPGVVGLFRPILLFPADIRQRLTPAQFESILAHELCHVRRRDNLTSAIHMVVEALYWFHPLVWWIGARLVEERERACDQEVVLAGTEPQVYVDGILKVCTSYLEPPLSSISGVAGADLKRRIRAILMEGSPDDLKFRKKAALAFAGVVALAVPIAAGIMNATSAQAQSRPSSAGNYLMGLGEVSAVTVVVRPQVDGQLTFVSFKEGELVHAGQVLASIDNSTYRSQLEQAQSQLTRDVMLLAELNLRKQRGLISPDQFSAASASLESDEKSDQAKVQSAQLQLTYTQIRAPITGVAGLRLVDPGNMVHAADSAGLLTITQLQPIAVLFNVPEDNVAQVMARLRQGANTRVELWNRDNTVKLATGRLTAADNHVDPATGTVKLKAMFDNKDGALFPNQFVNVRLFL